MARDRCRGSRRAGRDREMKGYISAFTLGVVLTLGACLFIGGNVVSGFRDAAERYRNEAERVDQALIRSQRRTVFVIREIETVRNGIDTNIGRIGNVKDGLEGSLDILRTVRGQRLD